MLNYHTFDVPVEGGDLRVGSYGDGDEVLLAAHGITGNHLHFGVLADRLGPGRTLVAPDLRGRGRSSGIVGPFSMSAHADDLVAVLDRLGVERATVIGHSMGAFAAVVCADRHPDRVRNLVLVDGGLPLELGSIAELPTDQLLAALIGPALDRLHRTFESVPAYLALWRAHPALADDWGALLERAIVYDLGGQAPTLRSTVRLDAVLADAESELSRDFAAALTGLSLPVALLRAERGMLNQIPPLYPDSAVSAWLDAVPALRSEVVPAVNHYTVLLSERGADAVSTAVEQLPN